MHVLIVFFVDLVIKSEVWFWEDDLVMDGVGAWPCEDDLDIKSVDVLRESVMSK